VSERRQSAVAVAASEAHYRLLAENTADIVFRLHNGIVSWMSPSVKDALGDDADSWIGRDITTRIHPDDLAVYMDALARIRRGEVVVSRARIHDHQGVFHWIQAHAKQYLDPNGLADGIICSMRIVDAEVAAEQVLDRLARFDDLTGLLNRGEALRRLDSTTRTVRSPGQHTAVLFCDVDRFKQVNDALGHAAGDEVLRVLAQRIRDCVRTSDLVARMGGDEIMVVLLGLNDPEAAVRIAEKIRASAAEPINTAEGIVHTSMSIGVTSMADGENPDALIARADSAMYEAKDIGRNRVIRVG
jgi:diguanylate cyclase (GGDEF)-like protein/PAS domain S-box-containing protein